MYGEMIGTCTDGGIEWRGAFDSPVDLFSVRTNEGGWSRTQFPSCRQILTCDQVSRLALRHSVVAGRDSHKNPAWYQEYSCDAGDRVSPSALHH